uniref:5-demethoxyubiquinone hydroxylase, mitochondrial n=1 Tax=Aceria tosichella TaxID=561515 RepID=A0A6G1SH05_9ACAR
MSGNTPRIAGYMARHRHSVIDRMLRVDHAGELGADRIYHGQSFVLNKNPKYAPLIQNMWNQEKEHLEEMEYMNLKYRTRKSLLEPFWSVGGFVMGSVTALMGPKAAMACTVAVESVITQHYNDQIRDILTEGDVKESQYMLDKFSKFRDDEQHHHDTAKEHEHGNDTDATKASPNLNRAIDVICRASIKIAEHV